MKLNRLLIGSPLVIAPIAMISSLCSCTTKFEAHAETFIQTKNSTIDIPLTFSYTPKQELRFLLDGQDLENLSIVTDHLRVKNNKATLQLKVAPDLWTSAEFNFNLQIFYEDLKPPYVIKDFDIFYIFEHPISKDIVILTGSKDLVYPIDSAYCDFPIQFEKMPHEHKASTKLEEVQTSDPSYSISVSESAEVVENMGKYFMKFSVKHDDLPPTLDFWASFNMVITFTNSLGSVQTEVFPSCTVTRPAIE